MTLYDYRSCTSASEKRNYQQRNVKKYQHRIAQRCPVPIGGFVEFAIFPPKIKHGNVAEECEKWKGNYGKNSDGKKKTLFEKP